MTLLHISTDPRTLGFVLQQMLFMRTKGWQVHAMASPGEYESTLRSHSISFHPVKMPRRITPFRDLVAIAQMWKAMRRLRPAIVHAHTPKAGLLGMISARLARVPIRVFHVHGLPHLAARGLRYRFLFGATKISCVLAHQVFCVSNSIRQVLIDQNLCPEGKVIVPLNGSIDGIEALEKFNPAGVSEPAARAIRERYGVPPTAFTLAFIGRLVRDKGLIELCEAWIRLRSDHPDLHLLIVGEFEPQDPIPSRIVDIFCTDPNVHMTGFCGNMPDLYAAIELVILPSYREGFGTVLIEAAAMGLPVVATAIPGCVDAVIDNMTGILVPSHDSFALAGAIERYMNDPELRRNHGVRARERILRDFRPEPIREFIYREYGQLLNRRGLHSPVPPTARNQSASGGALAAADLP
jgi:glycosyltransferase involved in cell wall biosynthesis